MNMWKGGKISESQKSFPNIIQQVKKVQKDQRKDDKITLPFDRNVTIISYKQFPVSLCIFEIMNTATLLNLET